MYEDDEIYQPYEIHGDFEKCRITINFDPELMFKREAKKLTKTRYKMALDHIWKNADMNIRKSAEFHGVEIP